MKKSLDKCIRIQLSVDRPKKVNRSVECVSGVQSTRFTRNVYDPILVENFLSSVDLRMGMQRSP